MRLKKAQIGKDGIGLKKPGMKIFVPKFLSQNKMGQIFWDRFWDGWDSGTEGRNGVMEHPSHDSSSRPPTHPPYPLSLPHETLVRCCSLLELFEFWQGMERPADSGVVLFFPN
jgi:hypothetical protein